MLGKEQRNAMDGRRLYRSIENRRVAGVAAGLADRFDLDPVWIRLTFAIAAFFGPGLILYVLLWFIVPKDPEGIELPRGISYWSIGLRAAAVLALAAIVAEEVGSGNPELIFILGIVLGFLFYRKNSAAGRRDSEEEGGLHRSDSDRKILGVIGGLADYFRIDSTLLRLIFVIVLVLAFEIMVPLYLLTAVILPRRRRIIVL